MKTPRFSANLGFLWTGLSLPRAIRAAASAGFDAVELHWPCGTPAGEVRRALEETGLPALCLNTARGDVAAGDFGLAALPGREPEARAASDQAIAYAAAIGCRDVHVMAGRAEGGRARATFVDNLRHAAGAAAAHGLGLLVEPLNTRDVPGYFLSDLNEAAEIVRATGRGEIRILLDCYHTAVNGGDLLAAVREHLGLIGHIQIAAVPDRGEPDRGEVDYSRLLPEIGRLGYAGYFGAEYRPRGKTDDGLVWMENFR